jgi:hypothetical protein
MRQLTFTADQFNTFVFSYVTSVPAENDLEFETGLRLLRKLKDPTLTEEVPPSPEELEAEVKSGGRLRVFPFYRLQRDRATFVLEEDEYNLLKKRMRAGRTKVATLVAEEFALVLDAIESVPAVSATTGQATA